MGNNFLFKKTPGATASPNKMDWLQQFNYLMFRTKFESVITKNVADSKLNAYNTGIVVINESWHLT
jgi:hypothetical protein